MAIFRYEAVDKNGKVYRGAMDAADEQAVAQRLAKMGYSLKAIMPTQQAAQAQVRSQSKTQSVASGSVSRFPVSVDPSVSLATLARFYRQLATMVRSGMVIYQSLDELSNTTPNRKLRRACDEMKSRVQAGDSLSSAMAVYPHLFPVHTVGTIWGGETGGYLDAALEDAASEIEQEAKDRRYAGIGYLFASINVVGLILAVPLLRFQAFLTNGLAHAARLAGSTEPVGSKDFIPAGLQKEHVIQGMIQAYAEEFVTTCIPLFIAWFVVAFVWRRLKRQPPVRRVLDSIVLRVPGWGPMHAERARGRFFRTLSRQYQAGVAPAQAWAAASMSVRNSEVAQRLRDLEDTLRHPTTSLQQTLVNSRLFLAEDTGMVGTGERSGSVPEMLERLSDHHDDVANTAKWKNKIFTILILIIVLSVVTGYFTYVAVQGYLDFAFDAPELLGLPDPLGL